MTFKAGSLHTVEENSSLKRSEYLIPFFKDLNIKSKCPCNSINYSNDLGVILHRLASLVDPIILVSWTLTWSIFNTNIVLKAINESFNSERNPNIAHQHVIYIYICCSVTSFQIQRKKMSGFGTYFLQEEPLSFHCKRKTFKMEKEMKRKEGSQKKL